ncbi:threonine ammonia-lyase, biosynthetic, partial [Gammaproteobacteria bacterium]|nr:threonine ammonia-lyase, biosynthetic [Gammaproteobacteria bacterium]
DTRVLSEPAGALALAGLKKYATKISNKRLLAISSGANVNFERLSYIVERSEVGENREKLLSIKIPEKPGSFLKLCKVFGRSQITEFNYRFANKIDAHVLVGIKTENEDAFKQIKSKLSKSKFKFSDLTKNQISNDHLRHMVGGHKSIISERDSERLYRCQFPVRPGALMGFLKDFGSKWNISLFHYRNLGAAFANVLIGIEDKNKSKDALEKHLKSLDYSFVEETDNTAYKEFLR